MKIKLISTDWSEEDYKFYKYIDKTHISLMAIETFYSCALTIETVNKIPQIGILYPSTKEIRVQGSRIVTATEAFDNEDIRISRLVTDLMRFSPYENQLLKEVLYKMEKSWGEEAIPRILFAILRIRNFKILGNDGYVNYKDALYWFTTLDYLRAAFLVHTTLSKENPEKVVDFRHHLLVSYLQSKSC